MAALIDAAIGWAFMPITIPIMRWSFVNRILFPEILWTIAWTVVWLWLVVHFGGTPGKLIIRARIVDSTGHFLSWNRAILRIIPSLIITINMFFQMETAINSYPATESALSFMEFGRLLNEYGKPYSSIAMVLSFFIYVDIGVIVFNHKKRAIHDFIAGSYVITKKSHEIANVEPFAELDGDSAGAPSPPVI